ncbi:IS701 family transposase [Streptomyces sp. NPDC006012]|uniref:IS701 family transposase n=1 Tax=Streptomyces sp. NPDC006012 TaxID=3364739 RepID=UPI00368E39B1
MTYVDLLPATTGRGTIPVPPAHAHDVTFAELCSRLFASLPRSDQYRKGIYYLRGLLEAEGRKSIRAIAALFEDHVSEQNLHHFISSSTWDWVPMRQALAGHLLAMAQPQAWVAQPMIIPKSGRHSVGVDRHFFPDLGQVLNAQRAIGVWAASDELTAPLNWRLHLPKTWLKDSHRRTQVAIPDGMRPETLTECLVGACAETVLGWGLPTRPLVVDTCEGHTATIFQEFVASGVPLMVRAARDLCLTVTDPLLPASGGRVLPAAQIMDLARDLRRPASWTDSRLDLARHTHLAATVRVALPVSAPGQTGCGDLALLGVQDKRRRGRTRLWLTNMTHAQPGVLVRLSKLTEKVDRDVTEISDGVGIRDFTGRSFGGWHRHVTLASAAHTVVALSCRPR